MLERPHTPEAVTVGDSVTKLYNRLALESQSTSHLFLTECTALGPYRAVVPLLQKTKHLSEARSQSLLTLLIAAQP